MTIELTVTELTVIPELNAVNLTITPTFTSGSIVSSPIVSISKNGVNIAPDELKNVDIEVPTATSDLTNDSGFIAEETDPVWNSEKGNYQTKADETLQTLEKSVVPAINELKNRIDGLPEALTFNDIQDLVTHFNAYLGTEFVKGQNALIIALDVPDTWITAINGTNVPYTYVDDAAFIADLLTGVQIGFYTLHPLETEKVNLENYYTKLEVVQLLTGYAPALTSDQNYVSDAELEVLQDTSGVNTGDETQETIGDLIELTELETVTDTTKIAASDSAFLKWFSGLTLKTFLGGAFVTLAQTTAQTIGSTTKRILKSWHTDIDSNKIITAKIVPQADGTSAIVFYKADGSTVVSTIDTTNGRVGVGVTPLSTFHGKTTTATNAIMLFEATSGNAWVIASANSANKIGIVGINDLSIGSFDANASPVVGMALERASAAYGAARQDVVFYNSISGKKISFQVNNAGTFINPFHILSNGGLDHLAGKFNYEAASPTVDTINDTRTSNVAGVVIYERCTGANATKGGGTWVKGKVQTGSLFADKIIPNSDSSGVVISNAADTQGFELSANVGANSDGLNIFIGGGGKNSIGAIGETYKGARNISLGGLALRDNTTGSSNIAIGYNALPKLTTGGGNIALGVSSQSNLTTGSSNCSFGSSSLINNVNGNANMAIGASSLQRATGSNNCAIGVDSMPQLISGGNNIAIGNLAGYWYGAYQNLVTSNGSMFIGASTRALNNNSSNEIVIGTDSVGNGNNTATIGNDSIVGTILKGWVYLNNGTHTGDAVGDRRYKIVSGIYEFQRCTVLNATRGSGTWVADYKILADGSHQFGTDTNNTTIEADGTIKFNGAATVFDDLLGDITQVRSSGPGVSLNVTESTIDFTTSANLSDYILVNYQLSHKWKSGSDIFPHIHWQQNSNATPNFLIQYRWQRNGQAKTTAWTNLKCNTSVFAYTSGTLNQIADSAVITPPTGYGISDIIQFRILRDNANTSGVFTGADTYSGNAEITGVDAHFEADTVGSRTEYTK